jgi:hypothetical protein
VPGYLSAELMLPELVVSVHSLSLLPIIRVSRKDAFYADAYVASVISGRFRCQTNSARRNLCDIRPSPMSLTAGARVDGAHVRRNNTRCVNACSLFLTGRAYWLTSKRCCTFNQGNACPAHFPASLGFDLKR